MNAKDIAINAMYEARAYFRENMRRLNNIRLDFESDTRRQIDSKIKANETLFKQLDNAIVELRK